MNTNVPSCLTESFDTIEKSYQKLNRIYSNRSHSDEQKQLMFSKISNYVETEISALDSHLNVEQSLDSLSIESNGSCLI